MQDRDRAKRIGSEKSKLIPALPGGAKLKSCPILAPPPLQGGENSCGKQGGAKLSSLTHVQIISLFINVKTTK